VVVAFDTEGVTQNFLGRQIGSEEVSELGVAVLRPSELCLRRNVHQFYDDNDIEAFTIRIHERTHGPVVGLMTDKSPEDAGPRLHQFLSEIQGERILLGYDMKAEWRYITRNCPSLSSLFSAWCDVQELVSQRYEQLTSPTDKLPMGLQYPGLGGALKALSFYGWTHEHQMHSAAGDSVKLLAVLSGLLCDTPLRLCQDSSGETVSLYCYLPRVKSIKISGKVHAYTARICTADSQKLPLQTPVGLERHFAHCPGLIGVGLNSQTETIPKAQVRYWWVSFKSKEQLDSFISYFDGSCLENIQLRVKADPSMEE